MPDLTFQDMNLSYKQIGEILKSDEVMNVCNSYARELVGKDQHIKSFVGFDRCHALIYDDIPERDKK